MNEKYAKYATDCVAPVCANTMDTVASRLSRILDTSYQLKSLSEDLNYKLESEPTSCDKSVNPVPGDMLGYLRLIEDNLLFSRQRLDTLYSRLG